MAAIEAPLTWSGLSAHAGNSKEKSSMATMRARMQAMTLAAHAKDAALRDLQSRLNAALEQAEQGRAREAALLRRAEKSEEAEEALASQMAELEAEAFRSITQANYKLLAAGVGGRMEPIPTSHASMQVAELERRLQAALEEGAALARQCEVLEEELKQGRARNTALEKRAKIAEEAEEALASQMAEVEAEAYTIITENRQRERNSLRDERCHKEAESIASSQVAELERRLTETGAELQAVNAMLRQAEEKNRSLEKRLAQEGEKAVTLKRKQGGDASEKTEMSLSLQEVAGLVKLKLWSPSSLALPVCKTSC